MNQMNRLGEKLMSFIEQYRRESGSYLQVFTIKENGRVLSVPAENVLWIESAGNYVSLRTPEATHLYRMTLNALDLELDPATFLRIHRTLIVNLRCVEKISYLRNKEYCFRMREGTELISGRAFKEKIENCVSS